MKFKVVRMLLLQGLAWNSNFKAPLMAWPRPTLLASVLCALVLIRSGLLPSSVLHWH